MDFELRGKLVLVTGASRGIGKAIALMLADQGADLIICGRNQDALNSAVKDIQLKGGQAWGFQADVSKRRNRDVISKSFNNRPRCQYFGQQCCYINKCPF